jgi:hypothetical protein
MEPNLEADVSDDLGVASKELVAGTLYFMKETDYLTGETFDYVKIGIVKGEKEVAAREKDHRTGNPRRISSVKDIATPAVQKLETHLHNLYARNRVSSGEWFYLSSSELEQAIEEATTQKEVLEKKIQNLNNLQSANKTQHLGPSLPESPEAKALVEQILFLEAEESANSRQKKELSAAIIDLASDDPRYASLLQVSITKASTRFDGTNLRKTHKELYESFMTKESSSWARKFLIEVPKKETESLELENLSAEALHALYLDSWAEAENLKWKLWILESDLLALMGDASEISGLVQWKETKKKVFDGDSFKASHPEIYSQFMNESEPKQNQKVVEWASYSAGSLPV